VQVQARDSLAAMTVMSNMSNSMSSSGSRKGIRHWLFLLRAQSRSLGGCGVISGCCSHGGCLRGRLRMRIVTKYYQQYEQSTTLHLALEALPMAPQIPNRVPRQDSPLRDTILGPSPEIGVSQAQSLGAAQSLSRHRTVTPKVLSKVSTTRNAPGS
jgi:hypothetical protein